VFPGSAIDAAAPVGDPAAMAAQQLQLQAGLDNSTIHHLVHTTVEQATAALWPHPDALAAAWTASNSEGGLPPNAAATAIALDLDLAQASQTAIDSLQQFDRHNLMVREHASDVPSPCS
jgi:hypothetical protein